MMRRLTFLIGGTVGYVLGARAGRGHYDAIKGAATRTKNSPKVRSAMQSAASRGNALRHQALEKAPDWVPGTGGNGAGPTPVTPATTANSADTAAPTAMGSGTGRPGG